MQIFAKLVALLTLVAVAVAAPATTENDVASELDLKLTIPLQWLLIAAQGTSVTRRFG
ncbi:hypothetical protein OF83DRAFT_1178131 [Amylostereum chailletii]|nr:hypothetical protein OF83DRAFT_1178131 [Amylostereum chailletii]